MNIKSLKLVNRLEGIASLELKLNFSLLGNKIPKKNQELVQYVKEENGNRLKVNKYF